MLGGYVALAYRRSTVRDLSTTDPLIEDIQALIDEALDDPSRASSVKALLTMRLVRADIGATPERAGDPAEADAEDLWDNVPL